MCISNGQGGYRGIVGEPRKGPVPESLIAIDQSNPSRLGRLRSSLRMENESAPRCNAQLLKAGTAFEIVGADARSP